MNMILIIDNYDSFVYNIARYVEELNFTVKVYRNNEITINEINNIKPSHIIISPGPCTPNEAGISLEVIKLLGENIPILGICLGHQAIGQAFGGKVQRAKKPMHGKPSYITHNSLGIFENLPSPFKVGRYHSLIVSDINRDSPLEIDAYCEIGEVMAMHHKSFPIYGVQFHPESILTEFGHQIINNFLRITCK